MGTSTNRMIVEQFWQDFSRGDYGAALSRLDDGATWWVGGNTPISGLYDKAAFAKVLEGVSEVLDGPLSIIPTGFTVEGDRVAVEAVSDGVARDGAVYRNEYHFLFVFEGEKVIAVKEYLDTEHARAVLLQGG